MKTRMIEKFWNQIDHFETGEIKNESSNILLAEARADTRMEAYVNMFYHFVWSKEFTIETFEKIINSFQEKEDDTPKSQKLHIDSLSIKATAFNEKYLQGELNQE